MKTVRCNRKQLCFLTFNLIVFLLLLNFTLQIKANTVLKYETKYNINTNNLTGWEPFEGSLAELNGELRSKYKVITVKPENVGYLSVGINYNLSIDWSLIAEDDNSVAVQFLFYINDLNFMKKSDGKLSGGKISFSGGETSYEWDITELKLKTGWNRILLNFRTSNGYGGGNLNLSELKTFSVEINKPSNVTELIIGFDSLEISTLTVSKSEEKGSPKPEYTEYNKKTLTIALIIAGAVVVFVFAEAIYFTAKEKKRLRRLKLERRRKRLEEQRKLRNKSDKQ